MAGKRTTDFLNHGGGNRRSFFRTTLGRVADEVANRAESRVVQQRYLRPPGALREVAFLASCTRCGECVTACPVSAILKAPTSAGLAAGTPFIDTKIRACIACEDMPCAAVCPTDALIVPDEGWVGYRMADLELIPERCITFYGSECGACARVCPVGDAAIYMDDAGRPVIKVEGCVGCGSCVRACVTSPPSLRLQY